MITLIIKKAQEPSVIRLTKDNLMKELEHIPGAQLLIENSWKASLKKVTTPYVCLLEDDCVLSEDYISINLSLMKQISTGVGNYRGGGYTKLAMMASSVGLNRFNNRFFGFIRWGKEVICEYECYSEGHYHVQVGFVPGAIMRYASIKDAKIDWDDPNLVRLSARVSAYLWDTNRRIKINPNTTYVSTNEGLTEPLDFKFPDKVVKIFVKENL